MGMLKHILTDKKKREEVKEVVEVVFAALTIAAFVRHKLEQRNSQEHDVVQGEVVDARTA